MTAFFAAMSALIIGGSDFVGGLAARDAPALRVTVWVQSASLATLMVCVWFFDAPAVTTRDLGAGVVAGLAGTFSFAIFYAALAMGQMSRVTPVAAVVGGAVTVCVVKSNFLSL